MDFVFKTKIKKLYFWFVVLKKKKLINKLKKYCI